VSGHSKWSTIKRQKGAADAKRGALFTKLGNAITIAIRETGEKNIDINFKLRLAIERARAANMPNENIERAIKRGAGELEGQTIESVVYEGFGPAGSALIIEALTDNKNRTASDIRSILTKHNGRLGGPNSVMWQFTKKGLIPINTEDNKHGQDDIEMMSVEAGADDVRSVDNIIEVLTKPNQLKSVQDKLSENGLKLESAELAYIPNNYTDLNESGQKQLDRLLDELNDNQAVVTIYDNIK